MARKGEQVLIFQVGEHIYGIPIHQVWEVVGWHPPTAIPGAPPVLRGVIDLRGQVVPVVDLGVRFGVSRARPDAGSRIIVVDVAGRRVGLLVDAVTEVHLLAADPVAPPAAGSDGYRSGEGRDPLVAGVARVRDRLVVLVDPGREAELGAVAAAAPA